MKRICITIILLACIIAGLPAQQKTIMGQVTDQSMNPLPGVTIHIKGTKYGVITDLNGRYTLSLSDTAAILVFSYIGYMTQEVACNKQKEINISLIEDIQALEEVVVVGYGVQRKLNCIGAVTSISSNNINRTYSGRVAGVTIRGQGRRKGRINSPVNQGYYNPQMITTESYSGIVENGFKQVKNDPLSTFSIDVDKASYTNVRRFINQGQLPPKDAVRVEEMINYFEYQYEEPKDTHPLAIYAEISECPWQDGHKLMHIGMQAKKVDKSELPPSNMVFLIDVSGSMGTPNKLPLLKQSLNLLVDELREEDRVAIVVYAGAAGLVLSSTKGNQKEKIREALSLLNAGGSTAGGEGIRLAYEVAERNFIKNGNNRVILATDGDFNVGVSSDAAMEKLITEKRETGIFLTCLGYGMGNYKDSKLEILADKGNGNYAYIDNIQEAEKQLVEEFGGMLFTLAKDVKIQIEFNPAHVVAYRLVGYENRLLNDEDFNDDTKDAGEIGAGQMVTALYEIIPVGVKSPHLKSIDDLKYQKIIVNNTDPAEIATVKVRYKPARENSSIPFDIPVYDRGTPVENASENLRFASSVAMFGMLLRESEYTKDSSFDDVLKLADSSRSNDYDGYKAEFFRLVKSAKSIKN
jgi:Ca-activated chloride channel family protein